MLTTKDEKIPSKSGVGVIVARFQVAELTNGHIDLIKSVKSRHKDTIVILGVAGTGSSTQNNPLDFESRQLLVSSRFRDVKVAYVKDCYCDDLWSRNLDDVIRTHTTIGSDVTLYGSRDGFNSYYSGNFETKVLEPSSASSGTQARKELKQPLSKDSDEFRQGAIWATQNQYPAAYPVVDVAIIDEKANMVLLGKKENETLWRLIGGFVDPKKGFSEEALEDTVKREAMEETSVLVDNITYVGSYFVDDWRYRSEVDSMMSVFFKATCEHGVLATAGDDIVAVNWFPLNEATLNDIGPKSHKKMFETLLKSTEVNSDE